METYKFHKNILTITFNKLNILQVEMDTTDVFSSLYISYMTNSSLMINTTLNSDIWTSNSQENISYLNLKLVYPPLLPMNQTHQQPSNNTANNTLENPSRQSSIKQNTCSHCTKSFSRRHDLARHIRLHTGYKPYVCPCCLKEFGRSDARRRHFQTETSCQQGSDILKLIKERIHCSL
ncbi:hypothetical protein BDF14DRAFT_1832794 [Spinellus fusiger]|nr:hypothetical protein BDF14DRAFT_1832794 [Spinellus fusiger]